MNSDMLRQVADAIEAEPRHFDIDYWFSSPDEGQTGRISGIPLILSCGTTMCIAGHAVHQAKLKAKRAKRKFTSSETGIEPTAANLLKLPEAEARRLFMPSSWYIWTEASPYEWQQVVAVLRYLAHNPTFDFFTQYIKLEDIEALIPSDTQIVTP